MTTELDCESWMQKLEEYTLNCYEYLAGFNSLKISGPITYCKKVMSLFDLCKIFLSNTCIKNSPKKISPIIVTNFFKKTSLHASLIQLT